jgi:UDP-N-acetylmuramate--alanine ligase
MKDNINLLQKAEAVHFIGIGGIGISAIARMLSLEGGSVTGTDISLSEVTAELVKAGAKIKQGQSLADIPKNTDLIIYTAAIEVADPALLKKIKKLKIPSLSYSEALGIYSKTKKTIAISGTHGKTTTTAMLATILMKAKTSPNVIVGSLLTETKTNYVAGKGEYLVVEADEYRRSFLSLHPQILLINNIDADHLDYYKDLKDVQSAFRELAKRVPKNGFVICNLNNKNVLPVVKNIKAKVVDYSQTDIKGLKLPLPGEHNRQNAQAALTIAKILGMDERVARKALENFQGTWRRFEYKGQMKSGALVYDDYAHNPQKVEAVILGAREMYPRKKIKIVFQPHLFSRTKSLLQEFAKALSLADEVILLPIYPAREAFDPTISSEMVADATCLLCHPRTGGDPVSKEKNRGWIPASAGMTVGEGSNFKKEKMVSVLKSFNDVENYLRKTATKNDVILIVGAGDVYKISEEIL